ncbi:MAG: tRNA dihydrouridine synthase [Candidatus Hodarchaeota archaeon]
MKLGTLQLDNNLLLAPMQEVTTAPYRRFCRKLQKIGLVCVPMIYTKRVVRSPDMVIPDLHKIEEENPISIQLIGSDLEALKKTILFLESYKFNVLDLNAGCPSKRALRSQEGAYLLNNLKKLKKHINAASKFSSRPISLKIRTGVDDRINITEFSALINDSNIEFLTIHGRTVKDKYNDSRLDIDTIKEIKNRVNIPVIGNGNIDNPLAARSFINYTNVDAIMIGRGSLGNPEIFNQINMFLKEGKYIPFQNDIRKMRRSIEVYEKCLDEFINEDSWFSYPLEIYKFKELKRNAIWLTKNIKCSSNIREQLSKTRDLTALKNTLKFYFEEIMN